MRAHVLERHQIDFITMRMCIFMCIGVYVCVCSGMRRCSTPSTCCRVCRVRGAAGRLDARRQHLCGGAQTGCALRRAGGQGPSTAVGTWACARCVMGTCSSWALPSTHALPAPHRQHSSARSLATASPAHQTPGSPSLPPLPHPSNAGMDITRFDQVQARVVLIVIHLMSLYTFATMVGLLTEDVRLTVEEIRRCAASASNSRLQCGGDAVQCCSRRCFMA